MMRMRYMLTAVCFSSVVAGAEAQERVYSDNVVIILDGSGSMQEPMAAGGLTKMQAAKQALHEVLSQLPPTTQVGLLVFSSNMRDDWPYPLGPLDAGRLTAAIDSVAPGGSTPLGQYIKKGGDRLLQQRSKQYGYGSYRLLIVTDGEAQDTKYVDRYTPEVVARGITVDVIGVRMQRAHTLATKVHSYRRADDPASLRQAIEEVMAEVSAGDVTDSTGADAFELLAAIPPEVAGAMVTSLSASGNTPIGEKPRARKSESADRAGASGSGRTRTAAPREPSGFGGVCMSLGFGAMLVIVAFVFIARKIRAGQR